MRVALLQISLVAGDVDGNGERIKNAINQAAAHGADLALTSELATVAYPSRDLLTNPEKVLANRAVLNRIALGIEIPALVGCIDTALESDELKIYNAAALLSGGSVAQIYHKRLLPTYDVFDEARYFSEGQNSPLFVVGAAKIGVSICEDAWNIATPSNAPRYKSCPVADAAAMGVDFFVNLSASPFRIGKRALRREIFSSHAKKHHRPMLVANHVGGHDDLIFDGGSMAFNASGTLHAIGSEFGEDQLMIDMSSSDWSLPADAKLQAPDKSAYPLNADGEDRAAYEALVLGLRSYAATCGFSSVTLGLSGGMDSALTAAIASEALGPKNVHCVAMPSRYSSSHSLADSEALCQNLGMPYQVIPIDPSVTSVEVTLQDMLSQGESGVTEENIQARMRALILMAISNKLGHLLLATGNKSEMAVGYTTLYGDMCGGLAVLGDVLKTRVYRMASHFNERHGYDAIPKHILEKAPSAELRPNQKDQDSLPSYEVLDEILRLTIEESSSLQAVVQAGFAPDLVKTVLKMIARSEHKRFQSGPVLRITRKAFGPGRRIPIAARIFSSPSG